MWAPLQMESSLSKSIFKEYIESSYHRIIYFLFLQKLKFQNLTNNNKNKKFSSTSFNDLFIYTTTPPNYRRGGGRAIGGCLGHAIGGATSS